MAVKTAAVTVTDAPTRLAGALAFVTPTMGRSSLTSKVESGTIRLIAAGGTYAAGGPTLTSGDSYVEERDPGNIYAICDTGLTASVRSIATGDVQ